jgi:uncharacterized Zn-binding protein involved in type VI secretion
MAQPAARMGDIAGHLGTIAFGAPTVLIGGSMAARKGDPILCPAFDGPKPHVGGVITTGSATVWICGMPAARMGDMTGCNIIGMPGMSTPIILGPTPKMLDTPELSKEAKPWEKSTDGTFHEQNDKKKGGASVMHAEIRATDSDKDGTRDTLEAGFEGARLRNSAYKDVGWFEFGGTHNLDVLYGNAKGTVRTGYGIGASGTAEAGEKKHGVGVSIAPAGSNGRNPYLAVGAEGNLMHAKAEGDVLVGNDGNRTGAVIKGEASAELASYEVSGATTTPSIFGFNVQARGKTGAHVGPPGLGGGAWLYYDHTEGRLHVGLSGKVLALFGVSGEVEFSAGREFQDPDAPPAPPVPPTPTMIMVPSPISFVAIPGFGTGGIPGTITLGCLNVLIG